MKNLFDENGKKLDIVDVIGGFIKSKEIEHNIVGHTLFITRSSDKGLEIGVFTKNGTKHIEDIRKL